MPYFTSWDVNVFLCLVSWGIPEDVIKGMMKMTKKLHQEFILGEAMTYWVSNSPTLVKQELSQNEYNKFKFMIKDSDKVRSQQKLCTLVNYLTFSTVKFRQEWRFRSVEERKEKVIDWCKFGDYSEQQRHQKRLTIRNPSPLYKNDYTKNLWKTWDAGASSYYFVGWNRRVYISEWYERIHPGRFFLFYKENKIIKERHKDGYQYSKTSIFNLGPYEQLIEDLRCIDGSGIGEKPGKTIEHIDDMFS